MGRRTTGPREVNASPFTRCHSKRGVGGECGKKRRRGMARRGVV